MNNISHTLASSAQRKKNIFDRQGEQVRMGRRDLLSQETVLRLGTLGLSSASGSDFCRILHTQGCADLCLVTCPHQHGWGQHIHLQQLEELLGTTWSLRVTCLEAAAMPGWWLPLTVFSGISWAVCRHSGEQADKNQPYYIAGLWIS